MRPSCRYPHQPGPTPGLRSSAPPRVEAGSIRRDRRARKSGGGIRARLRGRGESQNGQPRRICYACDKLCTISPLSTGKDSLFSLPRLGKAMHCHQVIGTEVPASLEGRQRQESAAGGGRTDLHRMAMRRACPSRTTGRGAGRVGVPHAVRGSPWGQATRKDPTQEGPRKIENLPSGRTTIGSDA
jgi:hypothetical protein